MKREMMKAAAFVIAWICLFVCGALGENASWDCSNPDCGRKGNTGNFCGGCGALAPWMTTGPEGSEKSDSAEKDSETLPLPAEPKNEYAVGDIVTFGYYEQDNNLNNGREPIEWIVLDYDTTGKKMLLLSRYGLDAKPYNTAFNSVTWEQCTLRNWLNHDFLRTAFNADEQSAILMTDVDNSTGQGYSGWNTNGGNNTQDRIFLLSYVESNRYLDVTYNDSNNTKPRVAPTAYAKAKGAYTGIIKTDEGNAAGWWWLRSPGCYQSHAANVNNDGSLLNFHSVDNGHACVRPALWINLESGIV